MSMFVNSVSFWRQNQNWFASQSANFASQTDATFSVAAAAMSQIGNALVNNSSTAGVLAARTGVAKIAKIADAKQAVIARSAGDIGNQVGFSGSLTGLVDFGAEGPSAIGGFRFQSGSNLTEAFKLAMAGRASHGSAIDTVTVTGNTLTASTSGADAHPVFTLTLQPNSGIWTFKLVNPIDGVANSTNSFVTLVNLSGLTQVVKSTGSTGSMPKNALIIYIYGDQARATGTATEGVVHQGGLAYTPPDNIVKPVEVNPKPTFTPIINPATGHAFVTTSASTTGNLVNIFS
jgi:hypothetical protein